MKKICFLLLTSIGCIWAAPAQNYIVDCYYGAPVTARLYTNVSSEISSETNITLQNGEQVQVVGTDEENPTARAIILKDGRKYLVPARFLVFSEDNPASAVDRYADVDFCPNQMLDPDTLDPWNPHSDIGKLLYSAKIPSAIGILLLIVGVLAFWGSRTRSRMIQTVALLGIPALLVGVLGLELYYFRYLGDDIAWWADPDYFPISTCILRSIPAMLAIAVQLISIVLYIKIIPNGENLSFKYLIWMVVLFIPIAIATLIVVGLLENSNSLPEGLSQQNVTLTVLGTVVLLGVGYSLYRNAKAIGFVPGLIFTAFFIFYCVGSLIALVAIGYIVAKIIVAIIIQLIALCAMFVGAAAAGSGGGSGGSGGGSRSPEYKVVDNEDYKPGTLATEKKLIRKN